MDTNVLKRNYIFIDMLRIIACFSVIINHTNSRIFLSMQPSLTWFFSLTYFFVSKIAVPIFIMISGYLMLNKEITYKKTFDRFIRILIALVLFSFVYYINNVINNSEISFNIIEFFKSIISTNITNAFWYLYMYLGLILMMPFIQKMCDKFVKKDFYYFFLFSLVLVTLMPIISYYTKIKVSYQFSLPLFGAYILMLVVGLYFKRYGDDLKKYRYVFLGVFVLMVALMVVLTYIAYLNNTGSGYLIYDNATYFPVVVAAISMFGFIFSFEFNGKISKVITFFGSLTFGIYLLSDLMIKKLNFIYKYFISKNVHSLISILILEISVFLACSVIVFVLKKIPYLKKLL